MKKKLVHVITGLNDGGAEGVLYRLCLSSSLCSHIVISLTDTGKYGSLLEESGVKVYALGMKPGRLNIQCFSQLVRLLRFESPDAVQTWMYHADLLGGIAAKVSGIKKIFWGIRHSTLEKGKAKRTTVAVAKLCAMLSRFIPKKIVCCAHKAMSVHRDIGYSSRKLTVISNGYDLSNFAVNEKSGLKLRDSLGVPHDSFLIGMVGRYDPAKDHNNLLSTLANLSSTGVDFKCLLIGKGLTTDNKEIVALIAELGLNDQVILGGQRSDIPAVMNALSLHVLSSSSEGFPNVIAEAMACGTPVVSTDVGDAKEIVGDSSLLCPSRDPHALSEIILKMHKEWAIKPDNWANRRVRCCQHIKNNFSMERMVADYENCWFGDERT